MHNMHPGANIHLGCKFAHGVYFGHVNGVFNAPGANLDLGANLLQLSIGANLLEQISNRVHICPGVRIAHMNATCYHICTI